MIPKQALRDFLETYLKPDCPFKMDTWITNSIFSPNAQYQLFSAAFGAKLGTPNTTEKVENWSIRFHLVVEVSRNST
jgi:hypothetical protein